jgi:hypothetical protein
MNQFFVYSNSKFLTLKVALDLERDLAKRFLPSLSITKPCFITINKYVLCIHVYMNSQFDLDL